MASQAIRSALPSHLKPSNNGDEAEFAKRHHGKTRSHMVSLILRITLETCSMGSRCGGFVAHFKPGKGVELGTFGARLKWLGDLHCMSVTGTVRNPSTGNTPPEALLLKGVIR